MTQSLASIFESPDMVLQEVAARLLATASALDDLTLTDAFKVGGLHAAQAHRAGYRVHARR
jgi:hypothetical protein